MSYHKSAKRYGKLTLLLMVPAFLTACGLSNFVYPGVNQSKAAVIENTFDTNRRSAIQAIVISVDGKKASDNDFLGSPVQVFVKPGRHVLRVTCSYNQAMNLASDYRQTLKLNLKPGFVYQLVSKPDDPRSLGGPCNTVIRSFPRRT